MPSSTSEALLAERLRDAVASGDTAAQVDAFQRLDLALSERASFPADAFDTLLEAMRDGALGAAPDSMRLIDIFTYNRDLLDPSQGARLQEALSASYGNYVDPAASMLILELLVNTNPPDRALDILGRLVADRAPAGRALLPYGLRYLCKQSGDATVCSAVERMIRELAEDRSQDVRDEAERALAMLTRPPRP